MRKFSLSLLCAGTVFLASSAHAQKVDIGHVDFGSLNFNNAVTLIYGNGARKIAVFEDPSCGYCKQLERDVATMKNVTLYVFITPFLGKDSVEKAVNVWCSANPSKSWADWMLKGVLPRKTQNDCDINPLYENVTFARSNEIRATPSLVFEDGTRVMGYIPAAQIEQRLASQRR